MPANIQFEASCLPVESFVPPNPEGNTPRGATLPSDAGFAMPETPTGSPPPIDLGTTWNSDAIPDPDACSFSEGPAATGGARRLFDLALPSCHDEKCLLGNRYLCRGSGMLLVGPTGIGKSAWVMQSMICWSVGRPAFGITPSGALKILIIQAENDDGDLAEMRDEVLAGLGLTEDELAMARDNVRVVTEDARQGRHFVQLLNGLLAVEEPDLVVIDPAFAYIGGSVSDQEAVTTFLRQGLTPLIRKYGCGVVVVHHMNKPSVGKEKQSWQAGDLAYAGGGSSEWANWARAVITIRSIGRHDVFEMNLGKRSGRLGWREPDGVTPRYKTFIGHSKVPGQIFWQELSAEESVEVQAAGQKGAKTPDDLIALVPAVGTIAKNSLIVAANNNKIAINRAISFLKVLITDGRVEEVPIPRPGKKPEVHITRCCPQSQDEPPPE